jgi:hypothetical protein
MTRKTPLHRKVQKAPPAMSTEEVCDSTKSTPPILRDPAAESGYNRNTTTAYRARAPMKPAADPTAVTHGGFSISPQIATPQSAERSLLMAFFYSAGEFYRPLLSLSSGLVSGRHQPDGRLRNDNRARKSRHEAAHGRSGVALIGTCLCRFFEVCLDKFRR